MSEIEYCIISDSSGHRWICPVNKRDEVEKNIEAIEQYWENADYDLDPPDEMTAELTSLEGENLTFTNPKLDGISI